MTAARVGAATAWRHGRRRFVGPIRSLVTAWKPGRPRRLDDLPRGEARLSQRIRRRHPAGIGLLLLTFAVGTLCISLGPPPASAATPSNDPTAIVAIARNAMKADSLKTVIVRVTVNGKPIVTKALGTSMTGVPATPAMHFRNGAVAISYMSTLLMEYVDKHKISLNDTVARWLPLLPDAGQVTVKMLANMTSGYPDYVTDPAFLAQEQSDPFRAFSASQLLAFAFSRPLSFPPGTNWGYAHTNYVVLGQILEKVGGKPLAVPKGARSVGLDQYRRLPDRSHPESRLARL